MSLDRLFSALSAGASAVFLLVGVYIYISLIRQISARMVEVGPPPTRRFGLPDALLATVLVGWFLLNIVATLSGGTPEIRGRDLVLNLVFSIAMLACVAIFLRLRGFDLAAVAGFSRITFGRVLATATILLLAAYPLIILADAIVQRILGIGSSRQEIVELFNGSQTMGERILIIILAVAIAPVVEEFIFRFFLYGVLKRYFGRSIGLVVNAAIFGAVHAHLPSFGPLFVLGSCFTIAYEWSGSILVSMTMHALFNSLTLTALAFPQSLPQ